MSDQFIGLEGLVISSASGTADTPRAHLVNPFGMECLRDLDLEDEATRLGTTGEEFKAQRWCGSMVGEEYGRVGCWGAVASDTARDVAIASPCAFIDLPQTLMEPLLVKYASHHAFPVKFNTELIGVDRQSDTQVLCTVRDRVTGLVYGIQTRFLFGADGGRSYVARAMDFQFQVEPSGGVACNVLFNADLGHVMYNRNAQLHWIMKPDNETKFGIAPVLRMIKPWRQWLLVVFSPGVTEDPFRNMTPQSEELIGAIKDMIGDESIEVDIERVDPWVIRETVAKHYSIGHNIHLLGDAAHRHPPAYGLGSNTAIQDAYNLAWKVALVSKGLAEPSLLDTYHVERQPVGSDLVRQANECMDRHADVWKALGMFEKDSVDGAKALADLSASTPAGEERRTQLYKALEGKRREGESLGLTMNQWYSSDAVYLSDETGPRPTLIGDPVTQILISTYPGNRLPHAWLTQMPTRKPISTHDLAGHGVFSLFTGIGGEAWKAAAAKVVLDTGVRIQTVCVGFGQQYYDIHRDWVKQRQVEDSGCILVRPDRYVAWRSERVRDDCESKLAEVMAHILQHRRPKQ